MAFRTNILEFNRAVQAYSDVQVERNQVLFIRRIALEVLVRTVQNTPVRTGRAKGGYIVSLEDPAAAVTGLEGTSALLENVVISTGQAVLAFANPFGQVWINNNVDYISYLEEGTDKFPPFAMAAGAVAAVKSIFPSQ